MELRFNVCPKLAIKKGHERYGDQAINIDLATLTETQRDYLSKLYGRNEGFIYIPQKFYFPDEDKDLIAYEIDELTPATAILALDASIEMKAKNKKAYEKKL